MDPSDDVDRHATLGELRLREAGELASAWLHWLASNHDIRALIIKGRTLSNHGLRRERISGDVDVLVEPRRFGDFVNLVVAAGWAQRPESFISGRTTLHSRTYLSPHWPIDVDVHRFFPGFLSPPDRVFDELWERRDMAEFAGMICAIPDRTSSILILGLHSLRGSTREHRHADELDFLTALPLSDAERRDIARAAELTGCAATLRPVLSQLGVTAVVSPDQLSSAGLRDWNERVDAGSYGAFFWLLTLRTSPWKDRPRILWRAVWPTAQDLAIRTPYLPDTGAARLRERTVRWWRGISTIPSAVRARVRAISRS